MSAVACGRRLIAGSMALALVAAGPAAARPVAPESGGPTRFMCDAITFTGTIDAATQAELEPVHTIAQIAAILARRKVPFKRTRSMMTIPNLTPGTARWLNAIPPGEPFVLPNSNSGTICVIIPSRS